MNTETQPPHPVGSSAWLADMVERWRNAEKHWRKQASARERSYGGQALYEDGLAEAFGRCADSLANEMSANEELSHGREHDDERKTPEQSRPLAPATGSGAVTAGQALAHCELWTRYDIELYRDAPFRVNLEHRLAIIREGLASLKSEPPNEKLSD